MTLIAHFQSFGSSTLVGDLLLSDRHRPPTPIAIPAARAINDRIVLPPNHFIAGLSQKVVLLSDHLAIAWSRSYSQAEDLISTLAPLGMMGPIDPFLLESVLSAIEPQRKNDLSYIICCIDAKNQQHVRHYNVDGPTNIGPMSNVLSAGTGSLVFLEIAKQFSGNVLLMNPESQQSDLQKGFDIGFLAALSGEEFSSPIGLQKGWGGGYEIIRQERGRFQKIGGILNLFFSVTEENSERVLLWWHTTFRHTDYWRGLTVVQAIEHEIRNGSMLDAGRHDIFLVSPPTSDNICASEFTPPNFNRYDSVLTWLIDISGDESLVYASAWERPVFVYSLQNNRVQVSFDREFVDDLIRQVQTRLRRPVTFAGFRPSPFVQQWG